MFRARDCISLNGQGQRKTGQTSDMFPLFAIAAILRRVCSGLCNQI